ncbi:hypothetical protein BB561_002665 [Smittium simulii]|uniref:Uncharacterized protein n=1 Tax=Smittium simulii TaxID=133385 RepID=A0A2T9YPK0_9FUNG|nr:hypothetical protein BB561_002665 [Smittium simulii]
MQQYKLISPSDIPESDQICHDHTNLGSTDISKSTVTATVKLAITLKKSSFTVTSNSATAQKLGTITNDPTRHVFLQNISHKAPSIGKFNQSFYINDDFYQPGVFCHGEIPADPIRIKTNETMSFDMELVRETGALVFLLELRNKYNNFIKTQIQSLPQNNSVDKNPISAHRGAKWRQKWFYYGSSLSGSLAQWLRITFPHLVDAAYASSGPVDTVPSYPYSDIAVYNALPCSASVANAVELIDTIFGADLDQFPSTSNIKNFPITKHQIIKLFGFKDFHNDRDFLYLISSMLNRIVATETPSHPSQPPLLQDGTSRINHFCSFFSKKKVSAYADIVSYGKAVKSILTDATTNKQYESQLVSRTAMGLNLNKSSERLWLWLTCNEMGNFAVSAKNHGYNATLIFSKFITFDYFWDQCQTWFGFNSSYTHLSMINNRFGGKSVIPDPRTVYVEGTGDPTYLASVVYYQTTLANRSLSNLPQNIIAIKNAYHHSEYISSTLHTNPDLKIAQKTILDFFKAWSLH